MKNIPVLQPNALVILGVVACFVLSGFAALLYQTAWMRQFSLVFGTSELAIAAVLSAYMGGLALGSSVAARYIYRVTRPVLFYGLLEAGIAASALSVPWLLKLASLLYTLVLGDQPEPADASGLGQSFFYLIIAFIVLAIPTTFMGATLPLLTKYAVRSKRQIGSRVGLLYATNTAGAVGGTLVAGFLLLPIIGLNGTVIVGVAINLIVFVLAAQIARYIGTSTDAAISNDESKEPQSDLNHGGRETPSVVRVWILPLMLLSGANSFLYEILWTRLLGHILGGSIAAFATMLAGFLSGIAIGSSIASRFARSRQEATQWFIFVQCGIALTSMLIYQLLPALVPETTGLKGNALLAILVLLPATVFIGATFPLAVRILATDEIDAAASSARVYSWNTVGAIIGATVAAFFIIPALKYEGSIRFAVLLNAGLAFTAAAVLARRRTLIIASTFAFCMGIGFIYHPSMPEKVLRASPVYSLPDGEIRYYEVGRSSTVLVIEDKGYLNLRNNGLPEASATVVGSPRTVTTQHLLSVMPVLARPDTDSMLIVGLGGGVVLESVPKSVGSIDVIELESEVVKANEHYGDERKLNPLDDPRLNIVINDARSALTLTSKRYDAIVSQPSHPWTAGASHLYTKEFMELAKEHLNEGGVYLQWMSTQFVDEYLLKSLSTTLLDVFPYVRVYQWKAETLFFLGSDRPLNIEAEISSTGRPLSDDAESYLENGIASLEDVVAALAMDQDAVKAFAQGGRVITDNYNIMATISARVMGTNQALLGDSLQKLLEPYDPLLDAASSLRQQFENQLDFPYLTRRLERFGNLYSRADTLKKSLHEEGNPDSLIISGIDLAVQGSQEESQNTLLLALQSDPGNQQARYALLEPWFSGILSNTAVPAYVAEQLPLLQGTAAATFSGWIAERRGDMQQLFELDAQLSAVVPSDYWYEDSLKQRSGWRIRLTNPEYQPLAANEATALIDRAILFTRDPSFLQLRMQSTYVAGDRVSTLETAQRLLSSIENLDRFNPDSGLPITNEIIGDYMYHVDLVRDLLTQISNDPEIPVYKIQLLEDSIERATRLLNAAAERV